VDQQKLILIVHVAEAIQYQRREPKRRTPRSYLEIGIRSHVNVGIGCCGRSRRSFLGMPTNQVEMLGEGEGIDRKRHREKPCLEWRIYEHPRT